MKSLRPKRLSRPALSLDAFANLEKLPKTIQGTLLLVFGIGGLFLLWTPIFIIIHIIHSSPHVDTAQEHQVKELSWEQTKQHLAQMTREEEVKYEANFWKTNTDPPVIARVMLPDGSVVVGAVQFYGNCPKGNWCAQPDATVKNEGGEDVGRNAEDEGTAPDTER